jgi:hypothetical protein
MKVFLRVILSMSMVVLGAVTMAAWQQEQDELRLRNGTVVRGRVSEMDNTTIVVRTTEGIRTYSRNEVQMIVFGGTATANVAPPPMPTAPTIAGIPAAGNTGGGLPAQTGRGVWRLREVRVFNLMESTGAIVRDAYDANGGFSEVRLNGSLYSFCPGGSETIRLSWRFPTSVAVVNDGDKVNIDLSGEQVARSGSCTRDLAARTMVGAGGSNGEVNPFNAEDTARIDGGRFWNSQAGGRISADPNAPSRSTSYFFEVDTRPRNPDRPLAWFNVNVLTSAGNIRYVYLYEFSSNTAPTVTSAQPPVSGNAAWRLRQVRVFNLMENTGTIVRDSYDANGGFSEVRLNGSLYGFCPGGSEVIRLSWQFPTSAAAFNDGDKVNINLAGEMISKTGSCNGALASRTMVGTGGSNGEVNPFNAEDTARIDGGRFWNSQAGGRVSADPNAASRTTSYFFEVDTRPHRDGRNWAWFNVNVLTSAGNVRYVYLYEWGTPAQVQFTR